MRVAVLLRQPSTDEGTFGTLTLDDGWKCATGELPARENQAGLSSIPAGAYICKWQLSPKHGWCYHVTGVSGRSDIEIHSANFCGDRLLGKRCQLLGCIAPGESVGPLKLDDMAAPQMAVLSSREATEELNRRMDREDFQLIIHDAPAIPPTAIPCR